VRIWTELTTASGTFSQTLRGYGLGSPGVGHSRGVFWGGPEGPASDLSSPKPLRRSHLGPKRPVRGGILPIPRGHLPRPQP